MGLALTLLLTLIIELPIIALFFRRKKRQSVLPMAALINIISWSIAHMLFFSTEINIYYIAIGISIGEAIAFHLLLPCDWKRAIIMSIIANSISFLITQQIPVDTELFPSTPEMQVGFTSNFLNPAENIKECITI